MSDKPFGVISCGTTDCECHNTNMPANCERSKKPNVSSCQKFTKKHPAEAQTMSDKPEKIWVSRCPADCCADYCDLVEEKKLTANSTEYIRADLAKPSEWISVTEDLPDDSRDIVAMGEGFSEIGFRSGVDTDPGLWADFHFTVSHWCELPANKPPTRETT